MHVSANAPSVVRLQGTKPILYDLTSTYFECDAHYDTDAPGLKRYGYSRDKRPDCLQVVIALVVTTEGLPLAYEGMPGDTSDKTTLKASKSNDSNKTKSFTC